MPTEAKTYPIIPSWSAILPLLLRAAESDSFESRKAAITELERMAELADRHVEYVKHAHQLANAKREKTND